MPLVKPVGKFVHVKFRYQEPISVEGMYTKEIDYEPAELLSVNGDLALVRFVRIEVDMMVLLKDVETVSAKEVPWWKTVNPPPRRGPGGKKL